MCIYNEFPIFIRSDPDWMCDSFSCRFCAQILFFMRCFFFILIFFHVILYFFDCLFCTHIIDYWKVVHTLPTHAMHCILCFLFNYVRVLSVIFFSYYFFPSIWVLLHVQLTWFMLCFFSLFCSSVVCTVYCEWNPWKRTYTIRNWNIVHVL